MPSLTPFLASAFRGRPDSNKWDDFGQRSGLSRSKLAAIRDIVEGLGRWELWSTTAWYDIRQRYRRSVLGPFWLTLSMGILVGTMGILYAHLFGQSVADYVPYLALGLIAWTFIASLITEGSNVFITYSGLISQAKAPLSTHVFRVVWRNLIIFAHNIWIYVAVAVIFGIWPGATGLLVIPGLFLVSLSGVWAGLLLGMLCVRFRDIPQIIANVVQLLFFLTPILWKADQLTEGRALVEANPFYHFVSLIREPLLGVAPSLETWLIVLAITAIGCALSGAAFVRFRGRIAYWI